MGFAAVRFWIIRNNKNDNISTYSKNRQEITLYICSANTLWYIT